MDHFNYRDGVLYAEDVPLTQLAASLGWPLALNLLRGESQL